MTEAQRSLLLIADIGGYTKFMKLHRMSLAHAEDITGRLLRAMVDVSPLPVIEVEGDAAFFSAPLDMVEGTAADLSLAMHQRFHTQLDRMIAMNMCNCDACMQTRNLKVKFVGHVGEVATQEVGGHRKLVGVDVITVHRMLKNTVPAPEYLLMTPSLLDQVGGDVAQGPTRIDQELEGLGTASLYFVDLERMALPRPEPPKPTFPRRLRETLGVGMRSFPRVVGLRPMRERPEQ